MGGDGGGRAMFEEGGSRGGGERVSATLCLQERLSKKISIHVFAFVQRCLQSTTVLRHCYEYPASF